MSLSRFAVISIGAFFLIFCALNAVLAFVLKTAWVSHLTKPYLLAYGAIYAIVAPFGLSGILGGLKRKRSLVKGFVLQYWLGNFVVIALSVVNYVLAIKALENCPAKAKQLNTCVVVTEEDVRASLINALVQSSLLFVLGLILLFAGTRECRQIEIDEEQLHLIAEVDNSAQSLYSQGEPVSRARYAEQSDVTPQQPNTAYNNTPNYDGGYAPSSNWANAYTRPTNANMLSRQPTNSSTLTRQTTNASTRARQMMRQSTGDNLLYPAAVGAYPAMPPVAPPVTYDLYSGKLARKPSDPFRRTPKVPVGTPYQSQYRGVVTRQLPDAYRGNVRYEPSVTASSSDDSSTVLEDDYNNYWQPKVAKVLAANLTRRGML